jgi:hypothetical protein
VAAASHLLGLEGWCVRRSQVPEKPSCHQALQQAALACSSGAGCFGDCSALTGGNFERLSCDDGFHGVSGRKGLTAA